MMIYRWQAGEILPDATLDEKLGLTPHDSFEDWLKQAYPHSPLSTGIAYHSIAIRVHHTEHDESCLIDVQFIDYSMLIWCEHWGSMLACYKWLVELAQQEYQLSQETLADEYLDDLLCRDDDDTRKVTAKARLIAAGYTADEVEGLTRQHRERQRAEMKRRKESRAVAGA